MMALLSSYPLPLACNQLGRTAQAPPPNQQNCCSYAVSRSCSLHSIFAAFSNNEPRPNSKIGWSARADASARDIVGASDWGEPVSLGTVKLPGDVNVQKLALLLYQWGNSLTQNANLPLPVPLKVDKIDGGVRLGYIKITDGTLEDLVYIDCVVSPATSDSNAMFRAVRNGRFKDQVPPGEPVIMQSLLQALRKSIELSKV